VTELEQYAELAKAEVNPSNGSDLVIAMERVSGAIVRVGELLAEAEHRLLVKERDVIEGLDQYDFSQAKVEQIKQMECIDEISAVRYIKNLLRGLNTRHRSLQSALSFLKSELRL